VPAARTFSWGGRYFEDVNQRETLSTEVGVLQEAPPRVPDASPRRAAGAASATRTPPCRPTSSTSSRSAGSWSGDTMDLWIKTAHGELLSLLKRVDGVVLNDTEAHELTGIPAIRN
jgi:hypothetical protein